MEENLVQYMPNSVYLWACGVKESPSDEDVTATDMTAGWITLAVREMHAGQTPA